MTGARFILAAAAATLFASSALADPPTGSRLGRHTISGPALSDKDVALGAKEMAACLYRQFKPIAVGALLASTEEASDRALDRLTREVECHTTPVANDMVEARYVAFPSEILRGMLAESALATEPTKIAALTALPLQPKYERSWFVTTGRNVAVDEMGACISDTNPAGVAALLATRPASDSENAAFAALTDNLVKCLRIGTRLQANRQSLRAALADALFQRIHRPVAEVVKR